jgi:hypothetical protein
MYTPKAEQLSAIAVPCEQCGVSRGELCTNGRSPFPLYNGPARGKNGFQSRNALLAAIREGRAVRIHSHQRRVQEFHAHAERVRLGLPSWDDPKGVEKYENH